jgi:hypothetical protein
MEVTPSKLLGPRECVGVEYKVEAGPPHTNFGSALTNDVISMVYRQNLKGGTKVWAIAPAERGEGH